MPAAKRAAASEAQKTATPGQSTSESLPLDLARIEQDLSNERIAARDLVPLQFGADAANAAALVRQTFLQARALYIRQHGGFRKEAYFGPTTTGVRGSCAALLYTEDGIIFSQLSYPHPIPGTDASEEMLWRLDRISDDVAALQRTASRTALQDRIANLMASLMSSIVGFAGERQPVAKVHKEEFEKRTASFRTEAAHLETAYKRLAERQAKVLYLAGTMTGLLSVIATWHVVWSYAPKVRLQLLVLAGIVLLALLVAGGLAWVAWRRRAAAAASAEPVDPSATAKGKDPLAPVATILTAVIIGLLSVGLTAYVFWSQQPDKPWNAFTSAILGFGALGTAMSVMMRLPNDSVPATLHNGSALMLAFGFLRPLVGGIFGIVLYILVVGGWVPLATPAGDGLHVAFFAGGAFLMGFSERLARDMVVVAGRRLGSSEDQGSA